MKIKCLYILGNSSTIVAFHDGVTQELTWAVSPALLWSGNKNQNIDSFIY